MLRRCVWILAGLLLCLTAPAGANGRFPASVSVHFQPGDDQKIFLATTFGLVYSPDDGETWQWTCEKSIGYISLWDPVYVITATGAIFATTPDGLRVSRDGGCTFLTIGAPLGDQWISDLTEGPDGALWVTTASGGQSNDVYVSRDDGVTFTAANMASDTNWWRSIRVAPTDPDRIYVTGYFITMTGPAPLLYRSLDGGMSWEALPFDYLGESQVKLLAVSPIDEDVVFLRVDAAMSDTILRSADGAVSFLPVMTLADNVAGFLARADGMRYVMGSVALGVKLSDDGGVTWIAPADMPGVVTNPKMACVGERPADLELFACGANWNPDRMGLGRSVDDAATWTPIFRFGQMDDEIQCAPGTTHAVDCDWTATACQFGIGKPDAGPGTTDAGPQIDGGMMPPPDPGCGCGISVAFAFFVLPGRRRRR